MKVYRSLAFVLLLAALMFAACSPADVVAPISTSTSVPTATPSPRHARQSAQQIVAGLKAKGLPIGETFEYNAANDPNHLLGRPNQYVQKVYWRDTRVNETDDHGANIAVNDGGGVEVFANLQDAAARTRYVEEITAIGGIFAEYDYPDGLVLLRVSTILTPDQAKAYQAALLSLP